MKNISIASAIEKNKLASNQVWLIALNISVRNPVTGIIDGYIRIVRNDEQVTIDGEVYEPMPFEISFESTIEGMPSVNVVMQDQTQIIQTYMQAYAGGAGFPVTVIAVTGANKNALSSEAELVEFFEVLSGSSDSGNYVCTWSLGVENPLAIMFPRRRQLTDQCSFQFKSQSCGYVGAAGSCDLTLGGVDGCRAKSWAVHYGGFPGLIARG